MILQESFKILQDNAFSLDSSKEFCKILVDTRILRESWK